MLVSYLHKESLMIKKLLLVVLMTALLQADSEPLQGKKFGVEFNFPRLLTYSKTWKTASGTFSYFDHKNRVEYAFPWMIGVDGDSDSVAHGGRGELKIKNFDFHYRKFLGEQMNGFYLSGFGRLTHLDGKLEAENAFQKTLKFGLGVGLGYLLFPKNQRFYWGAGLIVGRYLGNQNDIYNHGGVEWLDFDDLPIIIDVEFLKFGYAF